MKDVNDARRRLDPYRRSIAGTLLAARDGVMAPIRPVLRDAGVTEPQWRVLRVLMDEGPADIAKLTISALLHQPSVSRILQDLDQRGLIERRTNPADLRRSLVTISTAGQTLVDTVARRTLKVLDHYRTLFGAERLEHLLLELQALTDAIQGVDEASLARE